MDKFFNSDNVVMRTLSKIFDIGWLTLIYLVFCIPIVTVGAATTSLYYVSAKVLRHNRSYVWREFWHSFKTNFLQSTIAWVVTAIIVVLLWLNMNIVAETGGEKGGYLIVRITPFCLSFCVSAVTFTQLFHALEQNSRRFCV